MPPAYRTILRCRSKHHACAAYGALRMLYSLPGAAASLAVAAGASIPAAYALYRALILAAMQHVAEVAELPEDEVSIDIAALHGAALHGIDWPVLAARVGATFDEAACEAHLRACFGEEAQQ